MEVGNKKKIVFLDIDGTITTFQGRLPESAGKALKLASENGHELVLCTGRSRTQIYPFLTESGWFSGAVTSAGAEVIRRGETVIRHALDTDRLKELIDFMEEVGAYYYLQCSSGIYTTARVMEEHKLFFSEVGLMDEERERLFGRIDLVEDPYVIGDVGKLIYYNANASYPEIKKRLEPFFCVTVSSFELTQQSDGEITMSAYDKAYGMEKYLEYCGASFEDTLAFGDGPNDFEMMEATHFGVAMGNASDELKEKADMVTDPVDQDGLYHAFEKLGLI